MSWNLLRSFNKSFNVFSIDCNMLFLSRISAFKASNSSRICELFGTEYRLAWNISQAFNIFLSKTFSELPGNTTLNIFFWLFIL